ncbi:hypothetical protein C0J52_10784 [Blattella germanica]|nr:hypothetical protein C0J52_10784 [Blattella germanica]
MKISTIRKVIKQCNSQVPKDRGRSEKIKRSQPSPTPTSIKQVKAKVKSEIPRTQKRGGDETNISSRYPMALWLRCQQCADSYEQTIQSYRKIMGDETGIKTQPQKNYELILTSGVLQLVNNIVKNITDTPSLLMKLSIVDREMLSKNSNPTAGQPVMGHQQSRLHRTHRPQPSSPDNFNEQSKLMYIYL